MSASMWACMWCMQFMQVMIRHLDTNVSRHNIWIFLYIVKQLGRNITEFAYNDTIYSSIGTTLFFSSYGFHPQFSVNSTCAFVNPLAEEYTQLLKEVHHDVSVNLS